MRDRPRSGQKLKCLTAQAACSQQRVLVGCGGFSEVLISSLVFLPLKWVVCFGASSCCFFLLTSLGVALNQTKCFCNSYFSNVVAMFLEEHYRAASVVLPIPSQVCTCAYSTSVDFAMTCSCCVPVLDLSTTLTPA